MFYHITISFMFIYVSFFESYFESFNIGKTLAIHYPTKAGIGAQFFPSWVMFTSKPCSLHADWLTAFFRVS